MVQALGDCPSLQTLDLSQNLLTMDSCSELCQRVTTAPHLSFLSVAENLLSMRSLGYFMTAIMERQNTKKHMPLDLLDLSGNEGLAWVPPGGRQGGVRPVPLDWPRASGGLGYCGTASRGCAGALDDRFFRVSDKPPCAD